MTGGAGRATGNARADGHTVQRHAPAKINLHLAVVGRRPDGFHELVTVLQTIDLCDDVSLQPRQRRPGIAPGAPDVQLAVSGGIDVPGGEQNLAVRAAHLLLAELGAAGEVGLDILLHKRIPAGGGLGGGSSDAASVLAGLHELLGAPCAPDVLLRLAAALGSDVAFFLHGGTALCTGRGEIVRPLPPCEPFELTLVMPPFAVSTAAVYAELQAGAVGPAATHDADALARAIGGADVARLESLYRNDLEAPARRVEPRLAPLLDGGTLHLSGSGSTLFHYGRSATDFGAACPSALICYARSTSGNR